MKKAYIVNTEFLANSLGVNIGHIFLIEDLDYVYNGQLCQDDFIIAEFDETLIPYNVYKAVINNGSYIIEGNKELAKSDKLLTINQEIKKLMDAADYDLKRCEEEMISGDIYKLYKYQLRDIAQQFIDENGNIIDEILSVNPESVIPQYPAMTYETLCVEWEKKCIKFGIESLAYFNFMLRKYSYGELERDYFLTDPIFMSVGNLLKHGALEYSISVLNSKEVDATYTQAFKDELIQKIQFYSNLVGNPPLI